MRVGWRSQKAPSAKRRIKTATDRDTSTRFVMGQKAPSAKRCIKTPQLRGSRSPHRTMGQKAPSTKRHIKTSSLAFVTTITMRCQKASSAKRCIKTGE